MDEKASVLVSVLQLYGEQSFSIDSGAAEAWADTFTEDGCFESPSYPESVAGRSALTDFARRISEKSPSSRHIIVNAHVHGALTGEGAHVRSNLMIVRTLADGSVLVERVTTIDDHLVRVDNSWKIRLRHVTLERNSNGAND